MPLLIGSGDALTQNILDGRLNIAAVGYGFLLHFFLGPISYSTRTPGGLFAPMLAVGAQAGTLFFAVWAHFIPYLNATPQHFAIIGYSRFLCFRRSRTPHGNHPGSRTHGQFLSVSAYACSYFRCRHSHIAYKVSPIYQSLREASEPRS
jgi:CIC family chloride channel protein